MRRPGEVTDSKNGWLQVTFCRPDACQSCGACEGGKKETVIWIRGEADIGDIAVVDMPDRTILRASAMAYLLPLFLFFVGLALGSLAAPGNEIGAILGAVLGLAFSFFILRLTEKKRKNHPDWNPQLIEVLPRPQTAE